MRGQKLRAEMALLDRPNRPNGHRDNLWQDAPGQYVSAWSPGVNGPANDEGLNNPDAGRQIITLGDGADFIDVARQRTVWSQWTPTAGQEEDVVSSGGGNDTIITGYGSDVISAGAGNDRLITNGVDYTFARLAQAAGVTS